MFHVPEKYRKLEGPGWTDRPDAVGTNNGYFQIPVYSKSRKGERHLSCLLWCVASDSRGWFESGYPAPAWEHVSVSVRGVDGRCPTWEEMCVVKDVFWDPEDAVIQLHPPRSEYVNFRHFVLHLWRPIGVELPRPPSDTVGPRG